MILAPLRGVTIRCFRETFADEIRAAGFTEAITPFIASMQGIDPMKNYELRITNYECSQKSEHSQFAIRNSQFLKVTPQFIGKDPVALRDCLLRVKAAGYDTADLNCGCPYPMVRNKGRGSGILRTPDVLRRMLEVGCEVMGPSKFSIKARLGVDRNDELLKLMPMINEFPLRFLTVHARTARQMYAGICDWKAVEAIENSAQVPVVRNGDIACIGTTNQQASRPVMVGRSFIRCLGERNDSGELLGRYIAASQAELYGDRPVLGRMKELIAYWKDLPNWKRRWSVIKLCCSVDELKSCLV